MKRTKRRRTRTRRNPVDDATALFEAFHKRPPEPGELLELSLAGPVDALVVGELAGVIYRSGIGELWTHEFESPPKLFISADGHQLFIVGGKYELNASGLEG